MEIVSLDGYTEDEKVVIARDYLLPRQLRAQRPARRREVERHRRRAAPRSSATTPARPASAALERELGKLPRKVATAAVATGARSRSGHRRRRRRPATWLGRPGSRQEVAERTSVPGVATGLAVTGAGGDVLFVEVTVDARRQAASP